MPNTMPQSSYVDREVIVLTEEGVWLADGSEISHIPTRKLFARSLKRDARGYYLEIGHETKRIEVEDTAYFIERIEGLEIFISDGSGETLDVRSLSYRPGRLVARIKGGSEEAKFLRGPYHEILRDLEDEDGSYFLKLGKSRVKLA
jgi:hypothetical protein